MRCHAVYAVYLANNKIGGNAHWRTFLLGEQGDMECTSFTLHVIISSVVKFGDRSQIHQTAKLKSPPNAPPST